MSTARRPLAGSLTRRRSAKGSQWNDKFEQASWCHGSPPSWALAPAQPLWAGPPRTNVDNAFDYPPGALTLGYRPLIDPEPVTRDREIIAGARSPLPAPPRTPGERRDRGRPAVLAPRLDPGWA